MSSARIFNGIPRTFLIVFAGTAVALAAAVPGTTAAARAPLAGRHRQPAAAAHLTRTAVSAGRSLRASLAISISPATAHPARYTLTAYQARPGHRARAAAHARPGYRARSAARSRDGYQTPRQIAWQLMSRFSWASWEFRYLDLLWDAESSWNPQAANPYSGAYGIPQAVPGSKMASAGPDWRWSARTQIRWGMSYIADRYGSPYGAWQHESACGWY